MIGILCGALLSFGSIQAECFPPERGAAGAPGPQGSQGIPGLPGPTLSNYISAYTQGSSEVLGAGVFNPVIFLTNRFPPQGIVHPLGLDFSEFQILNTGVYRIGWTFSVFTTLIEGQQINVQLFDVSTNLPIPPTPFTQDVVPVLGFASISGHTIVPLLANTVIRLEVLPTLSGTTIVNPSFFIYQVAP